MSSSKTRHDSLPVVCRVLLACVAISAVAATPDPPPFTVDHWDTDAGLPPGRCAAILQTRDGYLWFGTYEGLARFDGVNCVVFDSRNTPELKSSRICVLYEDRAGRLWIGTEGGGLACFDHGTFRAFTREDGLRNDQINALLEDRAGILWVGTDGGGLFRFEGQTFTRFEHTDAISDRFVVGLAMESSGALLVAYRSGIRRIHSGGIETFLVRQHLGLMEIDTIFRNEDGLVCFGSSHGVKFFREGAYDQPVGNINLPNVETLHRGPGGDLWIGTAFGLYRRLGERLVRYSTTDGLAGNMINAVFVDHEGSVWVGNNSSGVDQIKPTTFHVYGPRHGLSHEVATCVFEDSRGDVWVGTEYGLNRFRDGQITQYTTNDGLSVNLVFTVCEDRDDAIWVGTQRGLNRFANGEFTRFSKRDGLPSNTIWCSYRDKNGNLWFGTVDGLARFDPETDRFQTLNHDNSGLSHDDVRSLCEDGEGRLWVGTSYGLNRLEGDRFVNFKTAAGRSFKVVLALHADRDGALWIGTMDKGLFRFKDGAFTGWTVQDGLFDNLIHQILEDDAGQLWLTCNRGVFRVSKKELNYVAEGRISRVTGAVFDRSDGLLSEQCNGTIQPAGCRTRDGRLWFPTLKGLAVLDPTRLVRNTQPPRVLIEKLLLDGQEVPMSAARLEPGVERVDIQYTALSFISPRQVRFQYRLEGFDEDWFDAKVERVARYTHLPPGDYEFQVRAANNDGIWNENSALLAFTVVPPWWRTWWSMTFGFVAFAGIIGGSVRFQAARKYRRHMAALERAHELERERARIARDMHDGLGASLVKISLLGEIAAGQMEDAPALRDNLGRMVQTARESVRDMDEIVWAINPRNDSIDNFATYLCRFAREHFEVAGVQIHLDVPTELPEGLLSSETRYQLFLAAKEVMTNIVKHAGATEVSLKVRADASRLSITLRDNGCGLPLEPPVRTGHGRKNLQERLIALGGAVECTSEPGRGTEFVLSLPLSTH